LERLLTIKDVSETLQVNERTIHRLIQSGKIPATKVGNQWRFHPAQLEVWFLNGGEGEIANGNGSSNWENEDEFLIAAPDRTLLDIEVYSIDALLGRMVDTLIDSGHLLQKSIFLQAVIERENHLSTGVGKGIALPHAWHPVNDLFHVPLIVGARLKTPLDFKAVDGELVDLVFLLCSPRNRMHLKLLANMASVAKDASFLSALRRADSSEEFCSLLIDAFSPIELAVSGK
jgi:nitrogen PTS system EIIA component